MRVVDGGDIELFGEITFDYEERHDVPFVHTRLGLDRVLVTNRNAASGATAPIIGALSVICARSSLMTFTGQMSRLSACCVILHERISLPS